MTLLLACLLAGSQESEMMELYAMLKQRTVQQRWKDPLACTEQEVARDADLAHLHRLYHVYSSNARAVYLSLCAPGCTRAGRSLLCQ